MNVIAAINTIYTRTPWIIRRDDQRDETWTNYGFSVEKIIIFDEPTIDKFEHYNNPNSSRNADKILEVSIEHKLNFIIIIQYLNVNFFLK